MDFIILDAEKKIIEKIRKEGCISLLRSTLRNIKTCFYVIYSTFKIRKLNKKYKLDSLVEFSYLNNEGIIRPKQEKIEILKLLKILDKPKYLLEIGTALGGTLFLFSRIAIKNATLISIDLPGGEYGGGYPKWKIPFFKSLILPDQKSHLIRANSHHLSTFNKVKQILKNNKLDFIFIDGDHSYEGVRKDFELYKTLVKKNGLIAFHDIKNITMGVDKFWNEIKRKYKYEELIRNIDQKGMGIGLLKGLSIQ